jgi:hypothetical protein
MSRTTRCTGSLSGHYVQSYTVESVQELARRTVKLASCAAWRRCTLEAARASCKSTGSPFAWLEEDRTKPPEFIGERLAATEPLPRRWILTQSIGPRRVESRSGVGHARARDWEIIRLLRTKGGEARVYTHQF